MDDKLHEVSDVSPLQRVSNPSDQSSQLLLQALDPNSFLELSQWNFETNTNHQKEFSKKKIWTLAVIVAIGCTFGIAVLATITSNPYGRGHLTFPGVPVSMKEKTWLSCGKEPKEARSLGCVFDVMLSSWVHSECHNQTFMDLHVTKVQFPWFRDRNMTQPVFEAEVRLGEYDTLYLYQDFHYEHCMYMWKVQMRAWKEGLPIDSGSWNLGHSEHCAQVMLDPKLEFPK